MCPGTACTTSSPLVGARAGWSLREHGRAPGALRAGVRAPAVAMCGCLARDRAARRAQEGPTVVAALRDLGVDQLVGRRRS